jgi:hypothetical protein
MLDIKDAEAAVHQRDAAVCPLALAVGPPMSQRLGHLVEHSLR